MLDKSAVPVKRPRGRMDPALESLIDETRRLFHRLRYAAEQIHGQGELTAARRGVLRSLDRGGPQTVPEMARARPVSRQHIQTLVNDLADESLVKLVENPAHKRSRLVRLTAAGHRLVGSMDRREAELTNALELDIPPERLLDAAGVLERLRQRLESEEWQQLVKEP